MPVSPSARPRRTASAAQYAISRAACTWVAIVGELELDRLELGDRLAERLALLGVRQRLVVRPLRDADRAGGDVDPAPLQRGQHLLHAAALDAAEQLVAPAPGRRRATISHDSVPL